MTVLKYRFPRAGDKLWKEFIGTGTIFEVDQDIGIVTVDFGSSNFEEIEIDCVVNTWTDRFEGSYMLYDEGESLSEDFD